MALIDRLTYKVGAPIPITGVQFGMRVEFGYDCLIPADFNNDVSYHARFANESHFTLIYSLILNRSMLCLVSIYLQLTVRSLHSRQVHKTDGLSLVMLTKML